MDISRTLLIAAVALVAFATDVGANKDGGGDGGGQRDPSQGPGLFILDRPAQQIHLETRFLTVNDEMLRELGVAPEITGFTLLVPPTPPSSGIYRSRVDPIIGRIDLDNLFGSATNVIDPATLNPSGLAFFYGNQLMIDMRVGPEVAKSYQPQTTAVDDTDPVSEAFRIGTDGWAENGFSMPRTVARDVPTQVLISDGQTVVMGFEPGVREYRKKTDIPILSDVPILGRLFVGRVAEVDKTSLVILITPTLTGDDTE